jgi:hypothetical protein
MTTERHRGLTVTVFRLEGEPAELGFWDDGDAEGKVGGVNVLLKRDKSRGAPLTSRQGLRRGEWFWNLDDGHMRVGRFASGAEALADAKRSIDHFRDVMQPATADLQKLIAGLGGDS